MFLCRHYASVNGGGCWLLEESVGVVDCGAFNLDGWRLVFGFTDGGDHVLDVLSGWGGDGGE